MDARIFGEQFKGYVTREVTNPFIKTDPPMEFWDIVDRSKTPGAPKKTSNSCIFCGERHFKVDCACLESEDACFEPECACFNSKCIYNGAAKQPEFGQQVIAVAMKILIDGKWKTRIISI